MEEKTNVNVDELVLEGRNAVLEALKSEKSIDKMFVLKNAEGSLKKIIAMASEAGVIIQDVSRDKLDEMSLTKNHQGVIAFVAAHKYAEVEEILEYAAEKDELPFVIILDGITDPHNLGAIIRTAECAGAHGVIIPKRRSATVNATVAKTSAGAINFVKVARVTNISNTIEQLQKSGLWIACADMDGDSVLSSSLTGPIALVIGGEGKGVSRLVKDKCDMIVNIPLRGKITSLNASVASAILMYEVVRQRDKP